MLLRPHVPLLAQAAVVVLPAQMRPPAPERPGE